MRIMVWFKSFGRWFSRRTVGQCCNCKREFPYNQHFCVDLICQSCSSYLPGQIAGAINQRRLSDSLNLVRKAVNSVDFSKNPEDWRFILNAILDYAEQKCGQDDLAATIIINRVPSARKTAGCEDCTNFGFCQLRGYCQYNPGVLVGKKSAGSDPV